MKRVIFYFDGFNFYNGLKAKAEIDAKWKNYYWMDFVSFCKSFLHAASHQLIKVKYFTAPPKNKDKRTKQQVLFNANRSINGDLFQFINGEYQDKHLNCNACGASFSVPEEKRTDVGIAVDMILDCINDEVDMLILISADSDQIPTIKAIKKQFPDKELKVYFPPQRNSTELRSLMATVVFLEDNEERFKKAVMPGEVKHLTDETKTYTRPLSWKVKT